MRAFRWWTWWRPMLPVKNWSGCGRRRYELPAKRRGLVAPLVGVLPVDVLELMLDVEEPNARGARHEDRRRLDQEVVDRPDEEADAADDHEQREVGEVNASPELLRGVLRRDPGADHERPERTDREHHRGMPEEPVGQLLAGRGGAPFGQRHRRHVALPAAIEVAGASVVGGVVPTPVRKRVHDDEAQSDSPRVVRLARLEQRAVRAVVKEDEGAKEEAGGWDRDQEDQPIRVVEQHVHHDREREVRHDRSRNVEPRPPGELGFE